MGYVDDVKTKTFIDDNASFATYVAAALTHFYVYSCASSFGQNGRKITATTSGSGDNLKLCYCWNRCEW